VSEKDIGILKNREYVRFYRDDPAATARSVLPFLAKKRDSLMMMNAVAIVGLIALVVMVLVAIFTPSPDGTRGPSDNAPPAIPR